MMVLVDPHGDAAFPTIPDFAVGFCHAQGIIMGINGGTHTGDSSDMAARALRYVPNYEERSDEYLTGFLRGIYSTHVCG